jgi:DUF4097 and DUF4098 domain-containing protein YvlB
MCKGEVMKRSTVGNLILLSLLVLALGGCGGGGTTSGSSLFYVSESFSFELEEGSNTNLTVLGVNGIIEVNGSAAVNSVYISGVMKVGSSTLDDAQLHLVDLDVVITELGTEVMVETVQPNPADGRQYIIEYSITIPDTMLVDVSQANGEVLIQGVESDITASQANGTIEVDSVLPYNGSIILSNGNGNISLFIPTNTSATLSCVSATGRVRSYNLNILDTVPPTSHSIIGTLGGGDGDISISTANGDITLQGI